MSQFRYRVSSKLGSGSFGVVYACTDLGTSDSLAIKFLKDEWLDDDVYRERFRTEARLQRRLKHPHILPIVYSNLRVDRPYIVMPRADANMADELETNEHGEEWRLDSFRKLLEGMAYAHEQDVLHRDLKPLNVLFVDGEPMIGDFGMGKNLAPDATTRALTTHSPIGTLAYMAPEQYTDPANARKPADVYALGKLLWELVTHAIPRPWAPDCTLIEDHKLRGFIERCCEEEPSMRFRDAAEALRAWDSVVGELAPSGSPVDTAHDLIEEWARTPRGPDIRVVRRLHALFHRCAEEEQLYFDVVPSLAPALIQQYATELPREFSQMFETYVEHIQGGLPFDYCDEVARLCAEVFEYAPQDALRKLALRTMLRVGANHNRYPVADQVRALMWGISCARDARLAAEVIEEEPTSVWYVHWQLFRRPLPDEVRAAFDRLQPPAGEGDVVF